MVNRILSLGLGFQLSTNEPMYMFVLYIYIYTGSTLFCTTGDNDLIIFRGNNNLVIIKFVFLKDKIL